MDVAALTDDQINNMDFDTLIDLEEQTNQEINKINFQLEGLNEEKDRLTKYAKVGRDGEEKYVFERRLSVINRQLYRYNLESAHKMIAKEKLSAQRQAKTPKPEEVMERITEKPKESKQ